MNSIRLRAALRWTLGLGAAAFVLIAAVLFLGPHVLDVPAVSAGVERRLSDAVQGRVEWDGLDIRLLPFPRAVLLGARVELPGTLAGSVESVQLDLRLLPLLRGRAEISAVRVVRPELRLQLHPAAAPTAAGAAPAAEDPVTVYQQTLRPVMNAMQRLAPDMTLVVEQGRVEMRAPGLPPLAASEIDLRIDTDATGMAVRATAVGEYWEKLELDTRIEFADLRGRAKLNAVGVKPQTALDALLANVQPAIVLPSVGAGIEASTDGHTSIDVGISAAFPFAGVRMHDRQLDVAKVRLQGAVKLIGQDIELALTDLRVGELIPAGKATLRLAGAERRPQASIEIEALDLERLGVAALAIAGDQPAVRDYVARLRGGRITDLRLSAKADTLAGLAALSQLEGSLTLAGGEVTLPILELAATDIGGEIELADSTLRLRRASARLGGSRLFEGTLDYTFDDRHLTSGASFDLDLPQAMTLARSLIPASQRASLERIRSLGGRAQGRVVGELRGTQWSADLTIARSNLVARVNGLPWQVSLREGRLAVSPKRIALSGWAGGVGASRFAQAGAELTLGAPLRLDGASASATLALEELYPWVRSQEQLAEALQAIPAISGGVEVALHKLQGRLDSPAELVYDVSVQPRKASVQIADLPGPVALDRGTLRIRPQTLNLDTIGVGMLDSVASVSGTLTGYGSGKRRIDMSVSEGAAGKELIEWIWQRAGIPPRVQPVTPLRFAAQRVQWSDSGLDVTASMQFEAGPAVGIDLGLHGGAIEVRRLTLKDRESDAVMGFATRGRLLDALFSGVLTGRSLASLFANAQGEHPGRIDGDLQVTLDRDMQGRTSVRGRLAGERLNLGQVLPVPIKVERIDVEGDGARMSVRELTIDWAQQKATIRGEIAREATGPVIRAEVDSPGIVLNALLPATEEAEAKAEPARRELPEAMKLWPLPLSGTLAVRAGYLQFQRLRAEPVHAVLALEPQRAELKVTEAALCGVAFPFTVSATPGEFNTQMRLSAKGQQLESVAQCFSDQRMLVSGEFDLAAELSAKGKARDIAGRLEGPVEFHARGGQIRQFALLGNILAVKNVSGLLTGETKLGGEGFGYRDIIVRGRFGGGKFTIEQATLDSDALGLAATGAVGLTDYKSDLTVLVAPFSRIDRLVRKVPIVGYIVGGTFTSVPVGVSGDIRQPLVVPLGPTAVTSQLVGIFERTLNLPGKLAQPLGAAEPEK